MEISFCSHPNTNKVIATIFGTWHDSWAVVACAKFCCDVIISNWIRAKWNFHHIWIVMEKSLVKWVPAPKFLSFICCFDHFIWFLKFLSIGFGRVMIELNSIYWDCYLQYIPRNLHTVFALLCFVVVIHWLIFSYPSGLLHWHCGNLTIAPVPAKQPWWIWINTSCEFIMNDCITTTKQSTTKPCAYFLGYTVFWLVCYCRLWLYINAKTCLEKCVDDIRTWMKLNLLKLNDDKTELYWLKHLDLGPDSV